VRSASIFSPVGLAPDTAWINWNAHIFIVDGNNWKQNRKKNGKSTFPVKSADLFSKILTGLVA
jgi:hypothetical protein